MIALKFPFASILLLTLFITSVSRAADKAPPSIDQPTADILNDIDSAAHAAPKAAPAPVAQPEPQKSLWASWRDLIVFSAPSIITAMAIGVASGICGVFVLLRREALLALALPQIVAAGAALGLRMGWPTLPPALVAAAAGLAYLIITRRRAHANPHAALPALYISGLCISFLIIAGAGAHLEDLQHLFVGIDVAVTPARAFVAAPILLIVAAAVAISWRRWLLVAQSPAAAELAGVSPARWDAFFLILLTTVLLLGTDSQGVVMVLAMLFLPAATVLPWARRIPTALIAAAGISLVMVVVAFILSNALAWPFSQSAGGAGFVLLLLSHLLSWLFC
jgi:ABC-type Mn2+/Zn2+ transport system permease subunit